MTFLLCMAAILGTPADDTYTVSLVFEKMHCDDCRSELESLMKKMGAKSVSIAEKTATLTFADATAVPAFNRLPKDLSLKSTTIAIRGTISFAGDKATLVAKGSGATLALVNPGGTDTLATLKKQLSGKNRFQVTGALSGGKTIALESFSATDW